MSRFSDAEHPLYGCSLKLRRANEHLEALNQAVQRFLRRNPYEVRTHLDKETQEFLVWTRIRETPPLEWGPLIGDVVHNLRSTLDHLAYQLVVKAGNEPTKTTAFPAFHDDPFNEHPEGKGAWRNRVKGMDPNDIALIKTLQPHNRVDPPEVDPLFILNELWNVDKHRKLVPVLTFHQGAAFGLKYMRGYDFALRESHPAGTCENGTIIASYTLTPVEGADSEVKVNTDVAFEIGIREGKMLKPLKLVPLLQVISAHVADILDAFAFQVDRQSVTPSDIPPSRG